MNDSKQHDGEQPPPSKEEELKSRTAHHNFVNPPKEPGEAIEEEHRHV